MAKDIYNVMQSRRTVYALSGKSTVSDDRLKEILEHAVTHVPTAFNSQLTRAVLLLGQKHRRLWEIVKQTLAKMLPAERFAETEQKIDTCFASGYGTVLFFSDTDVTRNLMERFAAFKDNFPIWEDQAAGMLQYAVWSLLAAEGMGASLQHYNPLIDDQVKAELGIPASWKLTAQMPFGKALEQAGEKEFMPLKSRLLIFE